MTNLGQSIDPVDLDIEIHRTRPDFVAYRPGDCTGHNGSTGNEHFLAFDGPDGSLMAVWTASTREGTPDQHIAFARSDDEGVTWSQPTTLAGPPLTPLGHIASWAFPLVTRRGRVYILYSQGEGEPFTPWPQGGHTTAIHSDDAGQTWSSPSRVPFAKTRYDHPDPRHPANWIVWQQPDRLTRDGRYYAGITHWVDRAVAKPSPVEHWSAMESVVSFMRFDNIDDHPEPADIALSFFAHDDQALRVPFPNTLDHSVVQEPSIVKLPDGRLFCTLRTRTGHPWWTQSHDDGQTWQPPQILQQSDGGPALLHPLGPCPIYDLQGAGAGSGRYVFFYNNNDGHFGQSLPEHDQASREASVALSHDGRIGPWQPTVTDRRPIYLLRGRFVADARQPIWFEHRELFMDQGDVGLGPMQHPRYDLSLYSSFTVRNGQAVLWYPDRKTFLLGRRINLA